jgi:hypothetical protein
MHLCLSIWFRAPIRNLCSRFRATWSRALLFPHTRKVPGYPLLSPRTLAKCAEAIYSQFNDKLICLAMSDLSRSSKENRHMSALLPEPLPVMTWWWKSLGMWDYLPVVRTSPPSEYCQIVGNFSSKLPRETRGGVLLSPQVWRDVIKMSTRDWYLMLYSNSSVTGSQTHTHTPPVLCWFSSFV